MRQEAARQPRRLATATFFSLLGPVTLFYIAFSAFFFHSLFFLTRPTAKKGPKLVHI